MTGELTIEPVPSARRAEALRLLVGGGRRDDLTEARGQALGRFAAARGSGDIRVWWARRRRRPLAAAMMLANPGRTGVLLYSDPDDQGVEFQPLVRLMRETTAEALGRGLYFVQAFVPPGAARQISALRSAGFGLLAELIYMSLDLTAPAADEDRPPPLRNYGESDETELARVVTATYEGSLDCPDISGLRNGRDVVEAHKAAGKFNPDSWWLLEQDGRPAGCILVNDSPTSAAAELVYMGVVRDHRGKGLGGAMVRFAARQARSRGLKEMTVVVDSNNVHARKVYDSQGFRATRRRLAFVRIDPADENGKS